MADGYTAEDVRRVAQAIAPEFPGAADDRNYRDDAERVLAALAGAGRLLPDPSVSLGEQPHEPDPCHLGGQPHLGPCVDLGPRGDDLCLSLAGVLCRSGVHHPPAPPITAPCEVCRELAEFAHVALAGRLLPEDTRTDAKVLAEALWAKAEKLRAEWPGNGLSIDHVNDFEMAADLAENLAGVPVPTPPLAGAAAAAVEELERAEARRDAADRREADLFACGGFNCPCNDGQPCPDPKCQHAAAGLSEEKP